MRWNANSNWFRWVPPLQPTWQVTHPALPLCPGGTISYWLSFPWPPPHRFLFDATDRPFHRSRLCCILSITTDIFFWSTSHLPTPKCPQTLPVVFQIKHLPSRLAPKATRASFPSQSWARALVRLHRAFCSVSASLAFLCTKNEAPTSSPPSLY